MSGERGVHEICPSLPIHWFRIHVREFLSDHSPGVFFGGGGYVKDIVYRTKVWYITDLRLRTSNAIATID